MKKYYPIMVSMFFLVLGWTLDKQFGIVSPALFFTIGFASAGAYLRF